MLCVWIVVLNSHSLRKNLLDYLRHYAKLTRWPHCLRTATQAEKPTWCIVRVSGSPSITEKSIDWRLRSTRSKDLARYPIQYPRDGRPDRASTKKNMDSDAP